MDLDLGLVDRIRPKTGLSVRGLLAPWKGYHSSTGRSKKEKETLKAALSVRGLLALSYTRGFPRRLEPLALPCS
jgi:hypothetical protein